MKVNGVEQTAVYHRLLTVTGTNNWSRVSLPLTDTGSKLIRIEAMASGLAPAVDDFLFEPLSGMPPDSPWISSEPSWSVSAGNLVAPPVTVASWVERTFDGPGLFTATVGATAGTTAGTNTVYLDGIPAIRLAAGTENLSLLVPAGPHTIRFHRSGALSAFQVSEIQFSPAQEPWLPALLDAPQLWFRTSTPYAFPAGTDAPRLPGNAYARWGSAQAGTVAVFAPGTGQFAVSWSRPPGTTPEFGAGFVFGYAESAAAAGQWVHSLSRESLAATWVTLGSMSVTSIGFSNVGVLIPANVHVDGLRFLPRSPDGLTLADAADSDGLTFHPSPDWLPLPFPAYSSDGVDGIVSTAPPGVSPAPLTATVTGPVTLTWAWKAGAGSFGVFVSGQPLQTTASRTFTRAMLQLGPGEHTLEWREVFAGADFVLDQFISRPGSVEREQFSHLLRAAATTDPPGSTWTLLTPGPSLRNYGPYATLNLESGLALLNQSLFQAPLKLEMITEIPVAEALEWNGPLTLEGNWKAYRCASGDFAWTSSSTRLSVTVTGPGVFSWIGGRDNHSVLVNDGPAYYSFDSRGPHRLTFLEEGSRTLTFAWNTWFLETLQWSPLTAQNDFATWAALHGLDPAAPDADADGDGRSAFHEFGFGGNPGQPDDGGLVRPVLVSRPGGATLPAVEFSGRREAGLRYELETLNAAGGWETDATALLELPGPGMAVEWLRLVSSQPVMPGTPRLLRVRTAR